MFERKIVRWLLGRLRYRTIYLPASQELRLLSTRSRRPWPPWRLALRLILLVLDCLRLRIQDWPADSIRLLKRALRAKASRPGRLAGWQHLGLDFRLAARSLTRNPAFSLLAVTTLALGIGACASLFTLVHRVLLRPLPFPEPQRLVRLYETNLEQGVARNSVAPLNYLDWKAQSRSFQSMAAFFDGSANWTNGPRPERVRYGRASAGLFGLLGVQPAVGRLFSELEDRPGRNDVAILSYGFWQSRFGRDPAVLGRVMLLDRTPVQIVGVFPKGFEFLPQVSFWRPMGLDASDGRLRESHFIGVIGRLKAETTLSRAQSELNLIARRLEERFPETNRGAGVTVLPAQDVLVAGIRPILLLLQGAAACVLLIACANVANLFLARAAARRAEIALRRALGAGRLRLVQQLVAEGTLLSLLGGVGGLALAGYAAPALVGLFPSSLPRASEVSVDWTVLAAVLGVSVLAGLVFALAPLALPGPENPEHGLRAGRNLSSSSKKAYFRPLLAAAQFALALLLLVGAGLLLHTFYRLFQVDAGFQPDHVLTFRFTLPQQLYPQGRQWTEFQQQLVERLQAHPQVEAVGMTVQLPMVGSRHTVIGVDGPPRLQDASDPSDLPFSEQRYVSRGYFGSMGIGLLQGRLFEEADREGSMRVAVVNQSFADRFFPSSNPVGQRFFTHHDDLPWQVVGVVGNVRHFGLDAGPKPTLYLSHCQFPTREMFGVLRTRGQDPVALAPAVQSALAELDQEVPAYDIRPMQEVIDRTLRLRRSSLTALLLFACLASALAAVGLFGLLSCTVRQRRGEFGIRMAIGAGRGDILELVLRQAAAICASGMAAGLLAATLLTRFLESLLFGVKAYDPLTFVLVCAFLSVVALFSCWLPARRAMRADPIGALRCE